jgi:hypothetical protein
VRHHEAQQSDGFQHAEKTEHQQQRQKDHPIPGESTPGLERTTRGLQRVIQIAKHQRRPAGRTALCADSERRTRTLALATVPLAAVAVEKAIYQRHPGFDFTPGFLKFAIWTLVPISLWWWLVFTRKREGAVWQFTVI